MTKTLTVAEPSDLTAEAGIEFTIAAANELVLADDGDLAVATDLLKQLKAAAAAVETQRKALTGPLNDVVKALNAAAKNTVSPILAAELGLRGRVNGFHQAQRDAEAKAREAAQEASGDEVVDPGELPAVTKTVQGSQATSSFRTRWTFEVTSVAAFAAWCIEQRVCDQFLQVDGPEIRRSLVPGHKSLPGLRVFEDSSVVVR